MEAASRTATNKKQSLEDSITDWLGEEEDMDTNERNMIASADTIQLNLEETSVFGTTPRKKSEEEDSTPEEEPESSDGKKKKKPMKLPKIPKNKHESSTTAADDVLRKFFNRR